MNQASLELADTAVRTVVLYSLMEFQGGNSKSIRVARIGSEFSVSDDGRGHPLDKTLEGVSYLRFIYTHFDYPFGSSHGAPVQLQGLGMSVVTALCSELSLEVRKQSETLTASFVDGEMKDVVRRPAASTESGITVRGRLRPELPAGADDAALERWLVNVAQAHPKLRLSFNGRELAREQRAA